jgi:uncharacterized protein with GYD domain
MPVFMTQFAYTPEAWAALAKRPEDRSQVLSAWIQQFGGRLICFYYAFGEYDGVFIFEAPDETAAAGVLMGAFGPGHNRAIKTTALLTVEQAMESMARAKSARYRPPTEAADTWRPYAD